MKSNLPKKVGTVVFAGTLMLLFQNCSRGGFDLASQSPGNSSTSTPPAPSPSPSPSPSPTASASPLPPADVTFTIDANSNRHAISPFIYGTNYETSMMTGIGSFRMGGNRWTTYNWENNATNGGTDNGNQSGNRVCELVDCGSRSEVAGEAARLGVLLAYKYGATPLVTIPIGAYVAADKNGAITAAASATNNRFRQNLDRKPAGTGTAVGSTSDSFVYQDEAVQFFQDTFKSNLANGQKIFYSLDNEPGIWKTTHPLIHPDKTTYAEMKEKTIRFASMIKEKAPNSMVFGAVAYGFNEMMSLQDAPDRANGEYMSWFLQQLADAEKTHGKRLVDVLDMHWGSEAQGDGYRVLDETAPQTADLIAARLQAPRSLWDPTYKENSWITNDYLKQPIQWIPRLKERIAKYYPGTRISFSEYNHGGGQVISGGIAEADVLGIFGREDVFLATHWDREASPYIYGAMKLYVNYDGQGSRVGDTSVGASTSNAEKSSVYAMQSSTDSSKLYIIAINKTTAALSTNLLLSNAGSYTKAVAYQISDGVSTPKNVTAPAVSGNSFNYSMPAMSVTTLILSK